jgi:RNA polymerase sigma-70 factor (ECF subfamily)
MSDESPDSVALDDDALRQQLRASVARYCPRWLTDQTDDIVQVAWLRLRDALEKDERNRPPGTSLLSRVAYCATIDEIRRLRRRREVPVSDAPEIQEPATIDPARASASREIATGIRSCLSRLSDNRKVAVTLYLQGHTAPQTGRVLGWKLKKAENMIFRGMADLRRCLAGKGLKP